MMNPKVIQLNCPSCGAAITNPPKTDTLTCPYCGNTFFFDKDGDGVPDHLQIQNKTAPSSQNGVPHAKIIEQTRIQQEYIQKELKRRRHNDLWVPLKFIFVSGLLSVGILLASMYQNKKKQQHAQRIAQQTQEREQKNLRESFASQFKEKQALWELLIANQASRLPFGFDKALTQLPQDWPTLTLGTSDAPVRITWYVTYRGTYDFILVTNIKTLLQKQKDKVRINVIPLPTTDGSNAPILEALVEIVRQKGDSVLPELHERLTEQHSGRILPLELCEMIECDTTAFNKAMKQHTHAASVKALLPVAKKLLLTHQTVLRIQDDLYIDKTTVYENLELAIMGYLDAPKEKP